MKRWRKIFLYFLCFIFGATLCFILALTYFWHNAIRITPRIIKSVRSLTNYWVGIDFSLDSFYVMPSKRSISIEKFRLSRYDKTTNLNNSDLTKLSCSHFFGADKLIFTIASNSNILELFHSKVVIDKAELFNVYYDMTAPMPDSKNTKIEIPWIPVKNIMAKGLNLKTKIGNLNIEDFYVKFNRDKNKGYVETAFNYMPFNSIASLTSDFDLDSGEANIRVFLKQQFSNILNYLNINLKQYELSIKNGNLELELNYTGNILNRINNPIENIGNLLGKEIIGKIKFENCDLEYKNNDIKVNIDAEKIQNKDWDIKAFSKVLGAEINVKGKANGYNNDYSYEFNKVIKNLKIDDKLLNIINFPKDKLDMIKFGNLYLTTHIKGNKEHIALDGDIDAKNFKIYGKSLSKLALKWNGLKKANIQPTFKGFLELESEIGQISATSDISVDDKNIINCLIHSGNIKNLNLGFFGKTFNQNISGNANGSFTAEICSNDVENATYKILFSVINGNFFGVAPKLVKGFVKGRGTSFNLVDPTFEFDRGGRIITKGLVSMNDCEASIKVTALPIDLLGINEQIATGTFNAEANIHGELLKPKINGSINASNIVSQDLKIKAINADVEGSKDIYTFSNIIIKTVDGSLLDGYVSLDANKGALHSLSLSLQHLKLPTIKHFIPLTLQGDEIDGLISGSISYNNINNQNLWSFYLDSYNIKLANQYLNSIFAEGNIIGKQADIHNLYVKAYDGSISLSGHMDNFTHFFGQVEGVGLNYKKMKFLEKYLPNFSGMLDFRGDIDFNGKNRCGEFVVFSRNMRIPERDLGNFGGNITINEEKLIIEKGEFDKLGIKTTGELKWSGKQPYQVNLEMNNVDLSFIPRSHGILAIDDGGLLINGKGKVFGSLSSTYPELAQLIIDKLIVRSYDEVMETAKPVEVIYQNEGVELRSFELKYKDGVLGAEGIMRLNDEAAFNFTGRNFSVDAIAQLAGMKRGSFGGIVSFDGRILGKLDDLKMSVSSEVASFTAFNRNIPQLKANIDANINEIDVKKIDVIMPNSICELSGKVNLGDGFSLKNFDLNLKLDDGPVSDIIIYAPELFKTASGTMDLDLNLRGTPEKPIIVGNLKILIETLGLKIMNKPLKNINITMSTINDIVKLDTFEVQMGKGKVVGEGSISFANNDSGVLNVKMSGEKLDLDILTLDLDNASFTSILTGDIMNPVFDMDIFLPKSKFILDSGIFSLKADSEPIKLPFHSLSYDVHVLIPGNFRVRNGFLNSEFSGDFGVSGDLENFKIDGNIKCVKGKLFFKQRQFKIDEGEIRFGGIDNSFDPYIYVKSEGQIQTTKIYLTLNGFFSNFKPQVYSTPPMSEGDIIAMLTLGVDLNSAQNSDSKDLFEEQIVDGLANSYLSSVVGGTISQALNLDEVYMTSVYDKGTGKSQSYIRVGKYITDKFFMAYEGNMEQNNKETYIFEYKLPRGFMLNLELKKPEQDQEIGLKYDFKF